MNDKVRCAVIGAGQIGLAHIEGFKKHPQAEVVAVADINAKRLSEAAGKHKVPKAVADYRELLKDKSIDVVSIALPNYLHEEVAVAALKAGKHVMLDKPMATNAREAQRIIDAWKEKKVVLMVGQNFRFNRDTQMVREYVKSGELGEVYHARAHWLRRSGIPRIGSWFTQMKYAGGGCCYDIGVHLLDCTLHCMGCFDAESVSGQVYAKFGPRGLGDGSWGMSEIDPKKPFDVEDLAVAMIKLKGGRTVILEISWAIQADSGKDYGIDLYGTEAGANLFPARILRVRGSNYETITPDYKRLPVPEDRMVHFIDCVVKGTPPLVKPEESLKVQKILDGIYESSKTGKEVRIK
ncbi:MAG: Gfo/Idh/MocA family oxidoreductase [Planctomycetota bacterium]|nr:Gfo/Idh/MocA family oxidoreductase [Planctomycetota bacterium]